MAIEILTKNHAEIEMSPYKPRIGDGKLVKYLIGNEQGIIKEVDLTPPNKNMFLYSGLHKLAQRTGGSSSSSGSTLAESCGPLYQVRYSRLGTGDSPSDIEVTTALESPIGSWSTDFYEVGDMEYNYTKVEVDNNTDYRKITYRQSQRHTTISGSDVVVREIGFSDPNSTSASSTITSRVVLDNPIPLTVGQYLITTYEFSIILPPTIDRPFENLMIENLPPLSGVIKCFAAYPTMNAIKQRNHAISSVSVYTTYQDVPPLWIAVAPIWGVSSNLVSYPSFPNNNNVFPALNGNNSTPGGAVLLNSYTPPASPGATTNLPANANTAWARSATKSTYQNDFKTNVTYQVRVDDAIDILVNHIYVNGYVYELDTPFQRYSDQSLTLYTTTEWNLIEDLG